MGPSAPLTRDAGLDAVTWYGDMSTTILQHCLHQRAASRCGCVAAQLQVVGAAGQDETAELRGGDGGGYAADVCVVASPPGVVARWLIRCPSARLSFGVGKPTPKASAR